MKASDAIRDAAARLAVVSDTPRLDAELLMAHAAGISREDLILRLRDMEAAKGFAALLDRRLSHEPVAQIIGTRDFWTLTLRVTPDVLTPRPDTETLIEAAVDHWQGRPGPRRILDLGTGSGALLLAALDIWPKATGLGVDISEPALAVARDNAQRCGMVDRASFQCGSWLDGVDEAFDLILANPPYICAGVVLPKDVADFEPAGALFAGPDGLDAYRLIAPYLADHLGANGLALFEIGYDQGESARALFEREGFSVTVLPDLAGRARCLKIVHSR